MYPWDDVNDIHTPGADARHLQYPTVSSCWILPRAMNVLNIALPRPASLGVHNPTASYVMRSPPTDVRHGYCGGVAACYLYDIGVRGKDMVMDNALHVG